MKPEDYKFPVWGTQGGGLVRYSGYSYVFVEAPSQGMGLSIGDTMPALWDIIPANDAARLSDFDQYGYDDCYYEED